MKSFRKDNVFEQKSKSAFGTFIYYSAMSILLKICSIKIGNKIIHIKYEDLIKDPIFELKRIEKFTGLNLKNSSENIAENNAFNFGQI